MTPEALRAELPVLHDCVYLNSCSMGATPRGAEAVFRAYSDALRRFRDADFERWWNELQAYENAIAKFIGAEDGTVVTDTNLSTLLGRVLTAFEYPPRRNRILTTEREFPTVELICRSFARYGAETIVVANESALVEAIDERTQVICVSHATTREGELFDIGSIARKAHEFGASVVVDAYQSVGIVPVDVAALEVDFLLGGAHKWMCGSLESAFLYVAPHVSRTPAATGWIAGENPFDFEPAKRHANGARRFASGTPAVLPALVSRVAHDLLTNVGIETIRARSLAHTDRIIARADAAGIEVVSPRAHRRRGGAVALRLSSEAARDADVARSLVARGFVCSYRRAIRISPHVYNTEEEIERFMDALIGSSSSPHARGRS